MKRLIGAILGLIVAAGGLALAAWRRARAPRRGREVERQHTGRQPGAVPSAAQVGSARLQLAGDGTGPHFHRRYRADIADPRLGASELMDLIKADFAAFSPSALASFSKSRGRRGAMQVGDEYQIKIIGPWNGAVRVARVEPLAFELATLEGHPEAGQICFQVGGHPSQGGALRFEINSWARSRDGLVRTTYEDLKLGQEAQKNTWVTFCERVVEASGGRLIGRIDILTEKQPGEDEDQA